MPAKARAKSLRRGASFVVGALAADLRGGYRLGEELGRGSFGLVRQAVRLKDGGDFVCKEVQLKGASKRAQEDANQEVVLLRRVSAGSEYIVQYEEAFLEQGILHIIMEYCERGDLAAYLKERGHRLLEEESIWKFLLQIGLALHWLHANRILHRDIKTLNVFLARGDGVRLGDLGVARVMASDVNFASTLVGTPYYLSPELCRATPYNDKSDVWAYGCVIYEMCALRRAFEAPNQLALVQRILQGRYDALPDAYSDSLRSLCLSCLDLDCRSRPSIETLLAEPAALEAARRLGLRLPSDEGEEAAETSEAGGEARSKARRAAKKRVRALSTQIARVYENVLRGLDAPTCEVWENLYRLLRAKMGGDSLSDADYAEIERYIFEELPTASNEQGQH